MEDIGAKPVEKRTSSAVDSFVIWLMGGVAMTTALVASFTYSMGVLGLALVCIAVLGIGGIMAAIWEELGRKTGLPALTISQKTFGASGTALLAIIFALLNVGWFGINTEVPAVMLESYFGLPAPLWSLLLGVMQIVIVLLGFEVIKGFDYISLVIILIGSLVMVYEGFVVEGVSISLSGTIDARSFAVALESAGAFSLVAWCYKIPETSRFCKKDGKPWVYAIAPSLGVVLGLFLFGILGLISIASTGSPDGWNIFLLGKNMGAIGAIIAITAIVANANTNIINLYPAVMQFLSGSEALGKKVRQPIVSATMGAIGTILAMSGILSRVTEFLNVVGSLVVPFSFVVFVDLFIFKNKDKSKKGAYLSLLPLISVFVGSAAALLSSNARFLIPSWLVGGMVSGVMYLIIGVILYRSSSY
ncbi:MAG: cytosine permease [Candidatus Thermoplasmatota archaeon]|nr:cytosine permease [Candidatus Thermoplasmatota archaeon]